MNQISITVAENWDKNILKRAEDLEKGTDLSYINIIKPFVINNVLKFSQPESEILDIGCGCGYLTNCIYECNRKKICGIDISKESINYAKRKYNNITFTQGSIYDIDKNKNYDLCLAIMLLNNIPDIDEFFKVLYRIISNNGKSIIVIPHPVYWTMKHIGVKNFNYLKENEMYEIPFRTKGRKDYDSLILYFHRTIQKYIKSILGNNFNILDIFELSENELRLENPDIMGIIIEKKQN